MADERSVELAVVGAGVMGSACALYAARPDLSGGPFEIGPATSVALVEQWDLGHRLGSSHGKSRIFRRAYVEDVYTRLLGVAETGWDRLSSEARMELLHRCGSVELAPERSSAHGALCDACAKHGLPIEHLTPAEAESRFGVSVPPEYVALYLPQTGVMNADRCVAALQSLAIAAGVQPMERLALRAVTVIRGDGEPCSARDGTPLPAADAAAARSSPHCRVGRFRLTLESTLSTTTTTATASSTSTSSSSSSRDSSERPERVYLWADRIVICPGPWANSTLEAAFGMRLPLSVMKIGVFYVRCRDETEHGMRPPHTVVIDYGDHADSVRREPYRDLMYTLPPREYPGHIKVARHWGHTLPDVDARTFEPPEGEFAAYSAPWLERVLRGVDASTPTHSETCLYTNTPDEDFVIDSIPLPESLGVTPGRAVLAAGFSGHGFKFGPVVGMIAAALSSRADGVLTPAARELLSQEGKAWVGLAGPLFAASRFV